MGCGVGEGNGWVDFWVLYILSRLYTLKYAKFCICDMSRLLRLCLYQQSCVFAHCVTKMPSRRMREDAKTFASAQLWLSHCLLFPYSIHDPFGSYWLSACWLHIGSYLPALCLPVTDPKRANFSGGVSGWCPNTSSFPQLFNMFLWQLLVHWRARRWNTFFVDLSKSISTGTIGIACETLNASYSTCFTKKEI